MVEICTGIEPSANKKLALSSAERETCLLPKPVPSKKERRPNEMALSRNIWAIRTTFLLGLIHAQNWRLQHRESIKGE
jgi:hypothetical protein